MATCPPQQLIIYAKSVRSPTYFPDTHDRSTLTDIYRASNAKAHSDDCQCALDEVAKGTRTGQLQKRGIREGYSKVEGFTVCAIRFNMLPRHRIYERISHDLPNKLRLVPENRIHSRHTSYLLRGNTYISTLRINNHQDE